MVVGETLNFLRLAIENAMHNHDYTTAIFLSERLIALSSEDKEETLNLLATAYYRVGKSNRVYEILKNSSSPSNRYLFALACFELEKFHEAERTLLCNPNARADTALKEDIKNVPSDEYGFELLGRLHRRTGRKELAEKYFRRALDINPLLWSAYQHLCQMGLPIDIINNLDDHAWFNITPTSMTRALSSCKSSSSSLSFLLRNTLTNQTTNNITNVQKALFTSPFVPTTSTKMGTRPSTASHRRINSRLTYSTEKKSTSSTSRLSGNNTTPGPASNLQFSTPAQTSSTRAAATTDNEQVQDLHSSPPSSLSSLPSRGSSSSTSISSGNVNTPGMNTPAPSNKRKGSSTPSSSSSPSVSSSLLSSSKATPNRTSSKNAPRRSARIEKRIKSRHPSSARSAKYNDINDHTDDTSDTGNEEGDLVAETPGVTTRSKRSHMRTRSQVLAAPTKNRTRASRRNNSVDAIAMGDVNTPLSASSSSSLSFATPSLTTPTPVKRGGARPGAPQRGANNNTNTSNDNPPRFALSSLPEESDSRNSSFRSSGGSRSRSSSRGKKTRSRSNSGSSSSSSSASSSSSGADVGILSMMMDGKEISLDDLSQEETSLMTHISQQLRTVAAAYALRTQYDCQGAISMFESLDHTQQQTGWVLTQMGRAYFELNNYPQSIQFFEKAIQLEPYRLEGMEFYSTALWHLKKEVELSFLAQRAMEFDRLAPETWVIVGNCFSLQKEHETALKFFRRAVQIDPNFAYAYTLSAHEYVANEDFDKGITGYRMALSMDDRHYNAWYGLGNIYYRQEQYSLAAYHFQRAVSIHQTSSVLYCYLGMVLFASGKYDGALQMLEKATSLEPTNSMAKFQKANVFMSMDRYEEALEELEAVRQYAPREASVHFLMGKIHRKLNQTDLALTRLITALDLDPKDRNLVKSAIDRLHMDDDDDSQSDSDMFA